MTFLLVFFIELKNLGAVMSESKQLGKIGDVLANSK